MTEVPPQLDLYPVLEGDAPTAPRITDENFRAIQEWTRYFQNYVDTSLDEIDGGGP